MVQSKLLLPRWFRIAGIILFTAGVAMSIVRFGFGYKPNFLETKVFVVYAAYLQSSEFRVITNNISEEICGITLLLGLFFMAFSRFREETAGLWAIRTKAFVYSMYTVTGLLLFCTMFIYGWGFLMVMTANLFLYLFAYNLFFYILYLRNR